MRVYEKPSVALISTGSELVSPHKRLGPGEIYDSNSFMIVASLRELGIAPVSVRTVPDRPGPLRKAIASALKQADVLILTGGVSAGEYDYCRDILRDLGVRTLFWKVSQKPGKPLFFGRLKRRLVFGLPGNPASVHLCFNAYVAPGLARMMGGGLPVRETARSAARVRRDGSKTLFLKGRLDRVQGQNVARVLARQGSHMISTLHEANGFIVVNPGTRDIEEGEEVVFERLAAGTAAA